MASATPSILILPPPDSPFYKLPLDIVAAVLAQLETIQQLHLAVLSHRIFSQAFNNSPGSLARRVIANQIPASHLPFAVALLESTRINPGNDAAAHQFLVTLATGPLPDPAIATATSLAGLSLPDYAFLSRNYAAAESLALALADEAAPLFAERLGLDRPSSSGCSEQECFRLSRAFFRYQIMCNLLCLRGGYEEAPSSLRSLFFSTFSPWVNEQLFCVYYYLERKLVEGKFCFAIFDYLVAHDVEWGELPINWDEDAAETPYIQWFLCEGLPFLNSVAQAKTYNERACLLNLARYKYRQHPSEQFAYIASDETDDEALGIVQLNATLESYTAAQLEGLARPSDGKHDSTTSSAFRVWFNVHASDPVVASKFYKPHVNILECAYGFWDHAEVPAADLRDRFTELRDNAPHFVMLRDKCHYEDLLQSQHRRSDIWLGGGRGFWPLNGLNFDGIYGLREGKEAKLLEKWQGQGGGST